MTQTGIAKDPRTTYALKVYTRPGSVLLQFMKDDCLKIDSGTRMHHLRPRSASRLRMSLVATVADSPFYACRRESQASRPQDQVTRELNLECTLFCQLILLYDKNIELWVNFE